jgi:acyl dehydratase
MASLALSVNAIETTFAGRGPMTALAIEWTRPVFPADRLTVRYEDRADDDGVGDVLFEVSNRRRRTVMRGGLVRFGASTASTASTAWTASTAS